MPIIIAPKIAHLLRNKCDKTCPDLYPEKYNTLLREIKDDVNEKKDILYSWICRLLLGYQFSPNELQPQENPNQNPRRLLKNKLMILKFIGNTKDLE